jgi:hypothetical protein
MNASVSGLEFLSMSVSHSEKEIVLLKSDKMQVFPSKRSPEEQDGDSDIKD